MTVFNLKTCAFIALLLALSFSATAKKVIRIIHTDRVECLEEGMPGRIFTRVNGVWRVLYIAESLRQKGACYKIANSIEKKLDFKFKTIGGLNIITSVKVLRKGQRPKTIYFNHTPKVGYSDLNANIVNVLSRVVADPEDRKVSLRNMEKDYNMTQSQVYQMTVLEVIHREFGKKIQKSVVTFENGKVVSLN